MISREKTVGLTPEEQAELDSSEHFELRGAEITPLTEIGETTARIFGFNSPKQLKERALLRQVGLYPSAEAMKVMSKAI